MDGTELPEQILRSRNLRYRVKEGFDEREKLSYTYFEVVNGDRRLGVDVAGEYTIFLAGWHAHYGIDDGDSAEEFRRDLESILDNSLCAACSYSGEADGGAAGAACGCYEHQLNAEFLKDMFGPGKTVKCRFFDEKLDREFRT